MAQDMLLVQIDYLFLLTKRVELKEICFVYPIQVNELQNHISSADSPLSLQFLHAWIVRL